MRRDGFDEADYHQQFDGVNVTEQNAWLGTLEAYYLGYAQTTSALPVGVVQDAEAVVFKARSRRVTAKTAQASRAGCPYQPQDSLLWRMEGGTKQPEG